MSENYAARCGRHATDERLEDFFSALRDVCCMASLMPVSYEDWWVQTIDHEHLDAMIAAARAHAYDMAAIKAEPHNP